MTFELSPLYLQNFALILARVSTVLVVAPVFGHRSIPPHAKIGLAVFVTLVFLPLESQQLAAVPNGLIGLVLAMAKEVAVGLIVAFTVILVMIGLQMAAQLVGVQIGFGIGQLVDPLSGVGSATLDQFYMVLATLVFLTMNGHYLVIEGLGRTFDVVPVNEFDATALQGDGMLLLLAAMFVIAIRIALPVMAAMLLTDLTLGFVARSFPQLNVLVVGLPLKVLVGLLVLMISLPATALLMDQAFGRLLDDIALAIEGT